MRIGLLNWSGHKNIGDDVMTGCIKKALELKGHEVINQGEHPNSEGIDAYFWGGGTLISQHGAYPYIPDVPTIGFGIGVCETPESKFYPDHFKNVRHVFARDMYSFQWLAHCGVPATLSFDPVFLLDLPKHNYKRDYLALNVIASTKTDYSKVKEELGNYLKLGRKGFSVGLPEDPLGCQDFRLDCEHFSDPFELHEFLSKAQVAITTRLHATIFAYMAGVPTIRPIIYDPKLTRFFEYVVVNDLKCNYMRERLNEHIDYALTMLSDIR